MRFLQRCQSVPMTLVGIFSLSWGNLAWTWVLMFESALSSDTHSSLSGLCAARGPFRRRPSSCIFRYHLDPQRFLGDLHCRKVSAPKVVMIVSSSVWGVRVKTRPYSPVPLPINSGLWLLGILIGRETNTSDWWELAGGRGSRVSRMVICTWDWGGMWNPSGKMKHHRGDIVKKWWEYRERPRRYLFRK